MYRFLRWFAGLARSRALAYLVAALVLFVVAPVEGAPDPDVANHRALLVWQAKDKLTPSFKEDVVSMAEALVLGGWSPERIVLAGLPKEAGLNEAALRQLMVKAYGDPGPGNNNDLKLFYYSGHGGELSEDRAPEDEALGSTPLADILEQDERISIVDRDDRLAWLWEDGSDPPVVAFNGPKVFIYDSCSAEGMFDGSRDPFYANTWALGADRAGFPAANVGQGGLYTKFLVDGLLGSAAGGDDRVTVDELHAYTKRKMVDTPAIWDTFGQQPRYRFSADASPTLVNVIGLPPADDDVPLEKAGNRCGARDPLADAGGAKKYRSSVDYDAGNPEPFVPVEVSESDEGVLLEDEGLDLGGTRWDGGLAARHYTNGGDPFGDLLLATAATEAFTLTIEDDVWGTAVSALFCTDSDDDGTPCETWKGEQATPFCHALSGTVDTGSISGFVVFVVDDGRPFANCAGLTPMSATRGRITLEMELN